MSHHSVLDLAVKIASTEKTPELASYWQSRYSRILDQGLFVLSSKIVNLIFLEEEFEKPATPFGEVSILKHLDANEQLDHIRLQSTVETAVRFLDACLDSIPFDSQSKEIVQHFRKIGLGLEGVSEYLETRHKGSELEAIDELGNLISNTAYRASETLAEEKGTCLGWAEIQTRLRPKSFELWQKEGDEARVNGLYLYQEFDDETILETGYKIIPRRNSDLLLFPPDLEWQIWSDRDENIQQSKSLESEETEPNEQMEAPQESIQEVEANQSHPQVEFLSEDQSEPESILENQVEPILENSSQVNLVEPVLDESLDLDSVPEPAIEIPESSKEQIVQEIGLDTTSDTFEEEKVPDSISQEHDLEEEQNPFQTGELVRITAPGNEFENQIYQIVDIIPGNQAGQERYQLGGGSTEVHKILWNSADLEPVDLDELLDLLNTAEDLTETTTEETHENQSVEDLSTIRADWENQKQQEIESLVLSKNKELEAEREKINDLKMELEKLKTEIQFLQSENHKSQLELAQSKLVATKISENSLDNSEIEEEVQRKIREYLNSESYQQEVEQKVQARLAQLKSPIRPSRIGIIPRRTE